MPELDHQLTEALTVFVQDVRSNKWFGKEREAVNLFAMGYLVPRCQPGKPLFDPTQIAIESRVPQLPAPGRKEAVCKDLVIWPEPGMTCWDQNRRATRVPLAIAHQEERKGQGYRVSPEPELSLIQ